MKIFFFIACFTGWEYAYNTFEMSYFKVYAKLLYIDTCRLDLKLTKISYSSWKMV